MTTLLPSAVPLFSSVIPSGQDPLGYMLSRVLSEGRWQQSPPQEAVWGILSVLSELPFDPNVVVENSVGKRPALTAALKLVNPGAARRYHRQWPTDLGAFSPQLLTSYEDAFGEAHRDAVDGEWLAAVLVAVGADPWTDCAEVYYGGLGSALHTALVLGAAGMAQRLWSVEENRPSLETLSTAVLGAPYTLETVTAGTWLEHSMAHTGSELARWLVNIGVRPLADRPHPAALAITTRHLQVFQDHGLLPAGPVERRALENAWRARLKKGSLSPELLVEFQQMLSPVALDQKDRQSQTLSATFEQIVADIKWDSSSYFTTSSNIGAAQLCGTAAIPKGPLMGTWNRLGVELVRRLKIEHARGVIAWDLSEMVGHDGSGRVRNAHGLDGALASALGVEWRPGVSLDGLLALAMLGMSDTSQRKPTSFLVGAGLGQQELIDTAAEILGIADVEAWAKKNLESAVAMTEALAKGGSQPACTRLQQVWATALKRYPTWLEGSPELSLRVLQAITYNFQRTQLLTLNDGGNKTVILGNKSNTGVVLEAMWPGLSQQVPPVFSDLTPDQRSLAVEIALMVHNGPWLNGLREGLTSLAPADLQRIEVFEAYARKHLAGNTFDGQPLSNRLREMLLEAQLPAPAAAAAKPRF